MTEQNTDAKALDTGRALKCAHNWKHLARWDGRGFYVLQTDDTRDVPVRLFLTPQLLSNTEDILYRYALSLK